MKPVLSVGFRTKTGKAIAIALSCDHAPHFLRRWNVALHDPAFPQTGQPHHEVLEMPWPEAQDAVREYENRIFDVATAALRDILRVCDARAIGVVGSPDRPLEKIGNRHIRAHAAEGMLFRHAVEVAAERCGVRCRSFSDRKFATDKDAMDAIGRDAGRPWRADERAAAMAAWLAVRK